MMKILTVTLVALIGASTLTGCKKEAVDTDVLETGSQETGTSDTDPVTDTDAQ